MVCNAGWPERPAADRHNERFQERHVLPLRVRPGWAPAPRLYRHRQQAVGDRGGARPAATAGAELRPDPGRRKSGTAPEDDQTSRRRISCRLQTETRIPNFRGLRPRTCEQTARRQSRGGDYAECREAVSSRSPERESRPEDHQRRGAIVAPALWRAGRPDSRDPAPRQGTETAATSLARPPVRRGGKNTDAGGGAEVAHAHDARSPRTGFEHGSPG